VVLPHIIHSKYAMQTDILGMSGTNQSQIIYWSGHSLSNNLSYYTARNDSSYVSYSNSTFNTAAYVGCTIQSDNTVNGYMIRFAHKGSLSAFAGVDPGANQSGNYEKRKVPLPQSGAPQNCVRHCFS
jgi:hypothetical protein